MAGVTPAEVEAQLYRLSAWRRSSRAIWAAVQDVGVRLWLDPPQRAHLSGPARQSADPVAGRACLSAEHASRRSTFVAGQPEITRDNLAQIVAVTAEIGGGHDLGSTLAAVKAGPGTSRACFPPASITRIGGAYKQQQIGGPRHDQGVRRRGDRRVHPAAVPLRALLASDHHHRQLADLDQRGLHRALADRRRAQHHGDDGHGDDHRHRDRDGDLPRLRISGCSSDRCRRARRSTRRRSTGCGRSR